MISFEVFDEGVGYWFPITTFQTLAIGKQDWILRVDSFWIGIKMHVAGGGDFFRFDGADNRGLWFFFLFGFAVVELLGSVSI